MENTTIRKLIDQLNDASKQYHNSGQSTLTDAEWDRMFDNLTKLEQKTSISYADSPTKFAGYEVSEKLGKIKHSTPLLSLDKTKSIDVLKKWLGDKEGVLMWKMDGSTGKLQYDGYTASSFSTRGTSRTNEGQDITHNMQSIKNIPFNITKDSIQVVGENVVSKHDFEKLNVNDQYQNIRNFGNATATMLDNQIVANRKVQFIAFNTLEDNNEFKTKLEQLQWLQKEGFAVVPHELVTSDNLEEKLNQLVSQRDKLEFESDGLVLAYNSMEYGASLGQTSHHFKNAMAFKFDDEQVETTLRDIEVSVGKSGQVSYVAIFDTVDLGDTDVSRATLHNYSLLQDDLEIGIDDTILIQKSGDIIPKVVGNITRSGSYKRDYVCPDCGSTLTKKINSDGTDSKHDFCVNDLSCYKQIVGKIVHFASRDAMNISSMGEETVKTIISINKKYQKPLLRKVSDIYNMPLHKDALLKLEGFGDIKVNKILESIEQSKKMPLSNVLYGLSVPQMGHKASKIIAEMYPNVNHIFNFNELDLSLQIGASACNSFVDNFDFIKNELIALKSNGLRLTQPIEKKSDKLKGVSFVITGKVKEFANRKELQTKIESLGGTVRTSVTSNTNYLICDDESSGSSKHKSAIKFGIDTINEDEFLDMI